MTSHQARTRVRRGAFRAALGVSLLAFTVGAILNLVLPFWWQSHGQTIVTITSGSMRPLIEPGDSLLIRQGVPVTDLAVGDVVTFNEAAGAAAPKLVSHRIKEIRTVPGQDGLWLQTQGDANSVPDPDLSPASAVVGVVESHLGWLGPVMREAQEPTWRLVLFGPAILLLGLAEVPVMFARTKEATSGPPLLDPAPSPGTT
jgi:signal peptidase